MVGTFIKNTINYLKGNRKLKISLIYLEYGLLFLYVFSLPSFSGRVGFNVIPYVLVAFLSVITILVFIIWSKKHFPLPLILLPFFSIWTLLTTILSYQHFRSWFTITLLILTVFILYYSFEAIDNPRNIIKIIVFAFLLFCFYFLLIYWKDILAFRSFKGESFRLGSYFDNVNQIGSYMSFAFCLSIYLAIFHKKKRELLYLLPVIIFIIIGISTGSKKFVVSVLLETIILLFLRFKNHKIIFIISIASLVAVFVILINLPFMSTIRNRLIESFASLIGEGDNASTTQRFLWQQYAFDLGFKKLIFGYGADGFSIVSGVGTYSHANISEILCNFGLFGLILFYSLLAFPFIDSIVNRNEINAINIVLFIILIFYSFTKVFYTDKDFYLMLALMYITTKKAPIVHDFKKRLVFYEVAI